jgi:nitrite reductase/ring-hydroxylating ferredoxin subunit/uncharacterized membrane protein
MSRTRTLTAAAPFTRLLDDIAGAIERAEFLDKIAAPIAQVEQKIGQTFPWWKNLLSGTFLGHPLHPLLVTVPIGSWVAAAVFDLVGDRRGAQRLIGMGILGALPTMASGASDWSYTNGAEQRVGLVHATSNSVTLGAYALSWWERRRGNHGRGVAWSALGVTTVSIGGWLGGHMSYALGVGVDTTAFQHTDEDWTPAGAAADVREGELTAGDAGGVPVLLTRRGGKVVAMADRCTHRGGPLHEGWLEEGCIVCPWHESAFDLDGAVVRGPATRPQLVYEVQERDGQVLVRFSDEPRSLRTNPVGV